MFRLVTSLAALALAAVVTTACEEDKPNDPTPNPNVIRFVSALLAANEVPPVTGVEAGASGTANITLNVTRDGGGNVTAATADFSVTLAGFAATSEVRIAHIHPGVAGATGGVAVDTGLAPGQVTLTNGGGSFSISGRPVQPDVAQNIINNPAAFYFNVHTLLNGGGAIRGQLVRQ
jgi:hypothetical protein